MATLLSRRVGLRALLRLAIAVPFIGLLSAANAGETAVVTRLSCAPETATDTAREPKERMYDYRRFLEVAFGGGREVRCFPAGDYAPEPALTAVHDRLAAALVALGAPADAPVQYLAFWQRSPDDKVPLTDVTRVNVELEGCIRPATDLRWVCRASVRAWYFKPGMSREGSYSELTVLATAAPDLSSSRYPFAAALALDGVARGKPPMDSAMVFP